MQFVSEYRVGAHAGTPRIPPRLLRPSCRHCAAECKAGSAAVQPRRLGWSREPSASWSLLIILTYLLLTANCPTADGNREVDRRRHPPRIRRWRRRAGNFRRVTVGYVRLGPHPNTVEKPGRATSRIPRLITTVSGVSAGLWLSQVEHRTLNPAVGGSNPPRPALTAGSGPPAPAPPCRWAGCRRTCSLH